MDEAERVNAYHEIQRLCIERVPIIIPYFMANFAAIRDNIEGFELKGFSGRSDLRVVKFKP
jgi:ABC-type transport system substrate-binding protein